MTKKRMTTYERHLASMSEERRKEFDQGLKDFALAYMVKAAMMKDMVSVRKLAKLAGVSPTIVQAMRTGKRDDYALSSVLKVLDGLGFRLLLEKNGEITPLEISSLLG